MGLACAVALTHGPRVAVPTLTAQTGSRVFASAIRPVFRFLSSLNKVPQLIGGPFWFCGL
jgi:hypothetical protein